MSKGLPQVRQLVAGIARSRVQVRVWTSCTVLFAASSLLPPLSIESLLGVDRIWNRTVSGRVIGGWDMEVKVGREKTQAGDWVWGVSLDVGPPR